MPAQLVLMNQFGEESINQVIDSDGTVPAVEVADGTIIANLSGDEDFPAAETLQVVADAMPAKTGVAAISASGAVTVVDNTKASIDTALATIVAAQNAILAALKVQS
jgi:hypothetical protein